MKRSYVLLPLLVLGVGACSTLRAKNVRFDLVPDQVVRPASGAEAPLEADVYVPKGVGPFPVAVVIYGGGWKKGHRKDMRSIAERFADRGYVVVSASYRFAPRYTFPAQLIDLNDTLAWIVSKAADLRADPSRTGLLGYSAGAHLALMMGYAPIAELTGRGLPPSLRIRAVAGGGSPTDLTLMASSGLVKQFLGTTIQKDRATFEKASPIHWASSASPPTFLYHGRHDWVVPIEHARTLQGKLEALHVPVRLVEPNLGHLYNFYSDEREIQAAIDFFEFHVRGTRGT